MVGRKRREERGEGRRGEERREEKMRRWELTGDPWQWPSRRSSVRSLTSCIWTGARSPPPRTPKITHRPLKTPRLIQRCAGRVLSPPPQPQSNTSARVLSCELAC